MPAVHGLATSVESMPSTVAPANAPTAPGTAIPPTTRQSTLPNRQCATPEASDVPTSDRCTDAEATTGASPAVSSSVVDVTPYAMPRLPSTSCAASPTRASTRSLRMPAIVY